MSESALWPQAIRGEARSAAQLLSRYPGPVIIRPPAMTVLIYAAGSMIAGGVMVWLALEGPLPAAKQVGLWLGAFLCLGVAPFFIDAIAGSSLQLSCEGLEISACWCRHSIRWQDASDFTPGGMVGKLVVFNNAAAAKPGLAACLLSAGYNFGLSNHGVAPEEMAALLNAWRERALRDDAVSRRCRSGIVSGLAGS